MKGRSKLKRRILIFASIIIFIIGCIIGNRYNNGKTISEIGGFKADDVTKISFQYDNPAIKGRTVEDREEINKFMNYINSYRFSKKTDQIPIVGYCKMVTFYISDKEVTSIIDYDKFIDINGTQYNMVKNKLSLQKSDDFIKSIF